MGCELRIEALPTACALLGVDDVARVLELVKVIVRIRHEALA